MTLSISAEARARVSTPPSAWPAVDRLSTMPPASQVPTPEGRPAVFRRTFRPHGRDGASYTLSLFDSGAPHPAGGSWLGYRLHVHAAGGPRRGTLLFAGADQPPPDAEAGEDLGTAARDVLERLTLKPGDVSPDPTASYNPEQLTFAIREAAALRELVRTRLGWRPEVPFNPRADLEALARYSSRSLATGGRVHRARLGVLAAEGATRKEAAERLLLALGHHACAEPEFLLGPYSGHVYALCPLGHDWAIYVVKRDGSVTPPAKFEARTHDLALRTFQANVERVEATYGPPKRRPSARAVAA